MSQLGTNIRRLRKEKGLSQIALAELCNVVQSTISDIETGDIRPSLELARRIATALNITLDDLVAPTPTPDSAPQVA